MLDFKNWLNVNESVEQFDPNAKYSDETFGYPVGSIDSGKVVSGGTDGNWGGSLPRTLWFARVADEWGKQKGKTQSLVTSQKRSRLLTASGRVSDHYRGNENSYAVDIAAKGEEGDELLAYIMQRFGHPEYKGGSWFNVTKNGYRYQVGWRVPNHFDHIHVGVKKIGKDDSSQAKLIDLGSFGANVMANPNIKTWFDKNMPGNYSTLSKEKINQAVLVDPLHKKWFMDTFGLDDKGLATSQPKGGISNNPFSGKIKHNYTGEKAANIELLLSEIAAQGVTNKHAVIGILSTIGKESSFVPKNEIPYTNTNNSRIRKIFGSRVEGLTDSELDKLKADPVKFWDRVYGATDPTGKSQQYGNSEPGDGAKYLGRGFNGITFKANYKKYGDLVGMDLVSNPDQLNDPKTAAKAAVKFLLTVLKTMKIDPNSFTSTDEAIKAFVQANHGGKYAPAEGLAKAKDVEKNFDIV